MTDDGRRAGSAEEFDDEWRRALKDSDFRFCVYPSQHSGRQADLFEWIKAQQIDELLWAAGIKAGTILEYGCGTAGIALYLSQQGHQVHICDLSPHAIQMAWRNRDLRAPEAKVRTAVVANVLRLPYPSNTFDAVMSHGLLEHFEMMPLQMSLVESIRVLRPGGLFLADIVPSIRRLNVRTMGVVSSYLGSVVAHILAGKWARVSGLFRAYFQRYYESSYSDQTWVQILNDHGLERSKASVCRPFPPLALSGAWERRYTSLMRRFLTLHQAFDRADNWLARRWGWMYLASARKPETRTEHSDNLGRVD